MATTQEKLDQDRSEFNAAFDEPDAPRVEQSEDEAFGLNVDAAAEAEHGHEHEPEAIVAVVDGDALAEEAGNAMAEGSAEAAAEEASPQSAEAAPDEAAAGDAMDDEPTDPKDIQRKKSWEGRLKAEEKRLKELAAELEAKSAAEGDAPGADAAEAIEAVAGEAADGGDTELAAAAEEVADQVEEGSMTAEQAMKQLAEDFGPDFVKMIEVIASAKAAEAGEKVAGEKFGQVSKSVEDIIGHLQSEKAQAHFGKIAEKHPDFDEIAQSDAFRAYVEGLPDAEKAEAMRVAQSGSADENIALLDAFKAATAAPTEEAAPATEAVAAADEAAPAEAMADATADEELDEAEGVRSAGLALPKEPKSGSDSYEAAWLEA